MKRAETRVQETIERLAMADELKKCKMAVNLKVDEKEDKEDNEDNDKNDCVDDAFVIWLKTSKSYMQIICLTVQSKKN